MAGNLVLHERSWTGAHRQTVIHSNEGPIWSVRWAGNLIAWANDKGVKIYDTISQRRITFIERPISTPKHKKPRPRAVSKSSSKLAPGNGHHPDIDNDTSSPT